MRSTTILIAAALATTAQAFSPVATTTRSSTSLQATTRKEFLGAAAAALVASSTGIALPAFAADTVDIQVKKKGDGPIPESGELVAIRFAAEAAGIKLDDIFDSPEPYYTRVGAGGLLQVRTNEHKNKTNAR